MAKAAGVERLPDAAVVAAAGEDVGIEGAPQYVHAGGGIDLGDQHLDGRAALDYVSFGTNATAAYADRLGRQQNALRALLDKAASSGMLADPIKLFGLLEALSHALSVDETLSNGSLQELGLQMRGLRTSAVQFLACPTTGVARENGRTGVHVDEARAAELWEALRADTVADYVRRNPGSLLARPR